MNHNKKITSDDIEEKRFNIVKKGYRTEEVEVYLNQIKEQFIQDETEINKLETEINKLNEKIKELTNTNKNYEATIIDKNKKDVKDVNNALTDPSSIARISRLEESVNEILLILKNDKK